MPFFCELPKHDYDPFLFAGVLARNFSRGREMRWVSMQAMVLSHPAAFEERFKDKNKFRGLAEREGILYNVLKAILGWQFRTLFRHGMSWERIPQC
jgi:hypothetical protein